jgi:hypothetical protein
MRGERALAKAQAVVDSFPGIWQKRHGRRRFEGVSSTPHEVLRCGAEQTYLALLEPQ